MDGDEGVVMRYAITCDQKENYLHCKVTGENSKRNVIAYAKDMVRECEKRQCYRMLIEEALEGPRLSILEVFQVMIESLEKWRGRYEKIAYVDVYGSESFVKFVETVAVNRGFALGVFFTVAEAEKWLQRNDPQNGESASAANV